MKPMTCKNCGQESRKWVEFCPNCSEPMEGYTRPAGFWIRLAAVLVDSLLFIPLFGFTCWNMFTFKSKVVLVLISVLGSMYKPFMEAFAGATFGKMACGIKVVDHNGNNLSLLGAYVRSFPFLIRACVNLVGLVIVFSSTEFQSVKSLMDTGQIIQQVDPLRPLRVLLSNIIIIECTVAAFTFRKRALHDMLAESFCVYNET